MCAMPDSTATQRTPESLISGFHTVCETFAARGCGARVFDFDRTAAEIYADLAVRRESSGRRLEGFDGLIAAIAGARGAAIATRNLNDFVGCGVTVVSPWEIDAR